MNVRLRMYKYCYSNLGAIYVKGLCKMWLQTTSMLLLWRGVTPLYGLYRYVRPQRVGLVINRVLFLHSS